MTYEVFEINLDKLNRRDLFTTEGDKSSFQFILTSTLRDFSELLTIEPEIAIFKKNELIDCSDMELTLDTEGPKPILIWDVSSEDLDGLNGYFNYELRLKFGEDDYSSVSYGGLTIKKSVFYKGGDEYDG